MVDEDARSPRRPGIIRCSFCGDNRDIPIIIRDRLRFSSYSSCRPQINNLSN